MVINNMKYIKTYHNIKKEIDNVKRVNKCDDAVSILAYFNIFNLVMFFFSLFGISDLLFYVGMFTTAVLSAFFLRPLLLTAVKEKPENFECLIISTLLIWVNAVVYSLITDMTNLSHPIEVSSYLLFIFTFLMIGFYLFSKILNNDENINDKQIKLDKIYPLILSNTEEIKYLSANKWKYLSFYRKVEKDLKSNEKNDAIDRFIQNEKQNIIIEKEIGIFNE